MKVLITYSQASGVKVAKICTDEFEKMKMNKAYRYIIFKLNDDMKEIIVDECAPRDATYKMMSDRLLQIGREEGQCRYAAFDLEFELSGSPKQKLVFIAWAPEGVKIKPKMIYTSSKDYLKKALQIVIDIQATDADELSIENCIEKAKRGMRD